LEDTTLRRGIAIGRQEQQCRRRDTHHATHEVSFRRTGSDYINNAVRSVIRINSNLYFCNRHLNRA
jgi:hypothetical protein